MIIRPSSLAAWNDCARRAAASLFRTEVFNAGYSLRRTTNNVGASIGTATHAAARHALEAIADSGKLCAVGDAVENGVEAYRSDISHGVLFDSVTANNNTAEKQIERMAKVWYAANEAGTAPVMIEKRLEADLGDGFILSGQVDLVANDPDNLRRGLALRDLKTGQKISSYLFQLGAYSLILRTHDWAVTRLVADFIPRVGLNRAVGGVVEIEQPQPLAEQSATDVIIDIKSSLRRFEKRLKTGAAAPEGAFRANPMSLLCGEKFCPAWGTNFCKVWRIGDIDG